jgi:hypothetical protein
VISHMPHGIARVGRSTGFNTLHVQSRCITRDDPCTFGLQVKWACRAWRGAIVSTHAGLPEMIGTAQVMAGQCDAVRTQIARHLNQRGVAHHSGPGLQCVVEASRGLAWDVRALVV